MGLIETQSQALETMAHGCASTEQAHIRFVQALGMHTEAPTLLSKSGVSQACALAARQCLRSRGTPSR